MIYNIYEQSRSINLPEKEKVMNAQANTKVVITEEKKAQSGASLFPETNAFCASFDASGVITPRTAKTLYVQHLMDFMAKNKKSFDVQKLGKEVYTWKQTKEISAQKLEDWFTQSDFKDGPKFDILGSNRSVYVQTDAEKVTWQIDLHFKLSEEENVTPGNLLGAIERLMHGQQTAGRNNVWRMERDFNPEFMTSTYHFVGSRYELLEYLHLDDDAPADLHDAVKFLKALYRNHIQVDAKNFVPGVFYHQSVQEALSFAQDIPALQAKIKTLKKDVHNDWVKCFDIQKHPIWKEVKPTYEKWLAHKTNYAWLSAAMTPQERKNMEWIHSMIDQ